MEIERARRLYYGDGQNDRQYTYVNPITAVSEPLRPCDYPLTLDHTLRNPLRRVDNWRQACAIAALKASQIVQTGNADGHRRATPQEKVWALTIEEARTTLLDTDETAGDLNVAEARRALDHAEKLLQART